MFDFLRRIFGHRETPRKITETIKFDVAVNKQTGIPHHHFDKPLPAGYASSRKRIHAFERRSDAAKRGWVTRRLHESATLITLFEDKARMFSKVGKL